MFRSPRSSWSRRHREDPDLEALFDTPQALIAYLKKHGLEPMTKEEYLNMRYGSCCDRCYRGGCFGSSCAHDDCVCHSPNPWTYVEAGNESGKVKVERVPNPEWVRFSAPGFFQEYEYRQRQRAKEEEALLSYRWSK